MATWHELNAAYWSARAVTKLAQRKINQLGNRDQVPDSEKEEALLALDIALAAEIIALRKLTRANNIE